MFWWKEDCEATPAPSYTPSFSPTGLRGPTIGAADNSNQPCPMCNGGSSGSGVGSSGSSGGGSNGGIGGSFSGGDGISPGFGSSGGSGTGGVNGYGQGSGSNTQQGAAAGNRDQQISFTAVADTYIRIDKPTKNYGNKKQLVVGTDGETVTLIKFDIKRARKELGCVDKATLSLFSLTNAKSGGVVTTYDPNIFKRDELWDETSINWMNAPKERPYKYYKEINKVRTNEWVEIDVTKELDGDRFITFRIVGGKWNRYASRESRHPPILSIDLC